MVKTETLFESVVGKALSINSSVLFFGINELERDAAENVFELLMKDTHIKIDEAKVNFYKTADVNDVFALPYIYMLLLILCRFLRIV